MYLSHAIESQFFAENKSISMCKIFTFLYNSISKKLFTNNNKEAFKARYDLSNNMTNNENDRYFLLSTYLNYLYRL